MSKAQFEEHILKIFALKLSPPLPFKALKDYTFQSLFRTGFYLPIAIVAFLRFLQANQCPA